MHADSQRVKWLKTRLVFTLPLTLFRNVPFWRMTRKRKTTIWLFFVCDACGYVRTSFTVTNFNLLVSVKEVFILFSQPCTMYTGLTLPVHTTIEVHKCIWKYVYVVLRTCRRAQLSWYTCRGVRVCVPRCACHGVCSCVDSEWRLLLFLLRKKLCSSFVWNSQGVVFYSHRDEWLWFADCRHIFSFSQKKRHVKRKKQLVQDLILPLSIYIQMCTLYTYTNICMPRFSPSGFFGPSKCLIPTPGLTSKYPICVVCACVCVYTHTHTHTLPPTIRIEKT